MVTHLLYKWVARGQKNSSGDSDGALLTPSNAERERIANGGTDSTLNVGNMDKEVAHNVAGPGQDMAFEDDDDDLFGDS